jgi:hypothetical protein
MSGAPATLPFDVLYVNPVRRGCWLEFLKVDNDTEEN